MTELQRAIECLYRTAKRVAGRCVRRSEAPTPATRARDDLRAAVMSYERALKRDAGLTAIGSVTTLADAHPPFELLEYWWVWCDIDGAGKKWPLGLLNDGRDAMIAGPCIYFPKEDFQDTLDGYLEYPAIRVRFPTRLEE